MLSINFQPSVHGGDKVDTFRAVEILNSKSTIPVTYQKTPIWITKIDEDIGMAVVKELNSQKILSIPITYLKEIQ